MGCGAARCRHTSDQDERPIGQSALKSQSTVVGIEARVFVLWLPARFPPVATPQIVCGAARAQFEPESQACTSLAADDSVPSWGPLGLIEAPASVETRHGQPWWVVHIGT